MTQAKGTIKMENVFQTVVIVLLVVIGIIGLVGNMSDEAPVVDFSAVEARLSAIEINQANTATGDVVVDNSIMEAKIEGFANILDDLMDDAYSEEVAELKINGSKAFDIELGDEDEENDDIVDEVEYLISGFDELASFYLDTDFGDNGTKYTIINLGLDDDDDKVIIVERLYSIRYELKDSTDKLKADILVTGTITYDDDEFEADLVFSLV